MCTRDIRASHGYTPSLDALVVALCRDYDRREESILKSTCGGRVAIEYRYINYRILEAAREIAGSRYALLYIREIGKKVGYANSEIGCLSESAYKTEKLEVKLAVARRLSLLD